MLLPQEVGTLASVAGQPMPGQMSWKEQPTREASEHHISFIRLTLSIITKSRVPMFPAPVQSRVPNRTLMSGASQAESRICNCNPGPLNMTQKGTLGEGNRLAISRWNTVILLQEQKICAPKPRELQLARLGAVPGPETPSVLCSHTLDLSHSQPSLSSPDPVESAPFLFPKLTQRFQLVACTRGLERTQ